ncbi:uncharacterized protein LOC132540379 isoform X1 [Erinaceus europaeus]|uniref:Uncharacterized protein LOC132540379 isoform X1 n=1 Tax=Erinaceus europaeus TaxID=9365 RepID=A0ABM3XXP2_ERIEU|nr:uncharacterized protein LOC132540379 isoform X1 [Erinaceus europaeus]
MAEPGSAQARSRAGANSGHLWTAPTAAAPNQRCEEVGLIRERLPGIGRHGAVVNPVRLGERARLPDSRTLPDTSASVKRKIFKFIVDSEPTKTEMVFELLPTPATENKVRANWEMSPERLSESSFSRSTSRFLSACDVSHSIDTGLSCVLLQKTCPSWKLGHKHCSLTPSPSLYRKWKQPERTSTRSCRTLPRINVHIQTISLFIAMEEAGKDNPPGMHGILSFLLCWPRNELRTSYSCMITPLSSLPGSTFSFFISLKGQGEQGGVQIEKANIIAPLHRSWRFPLCCDRT